MSQDISQNNKRIAKNTLMLYLRMFFIMGVTLYTSRVVLATLGVEDYGIYNVVGGVIAMLGFLNSAMVTATQRYLTFELGKKANEVLKRVFATSFQIHAIIALTVLVLGEIVGLWFIHNKMVIPPERLDAALWVFQCSVLSTMVSIMCVPFNATIIAHEKMSAFAYISIFEVSLKLLIVYLLVISDFDKLKLYAVLVLCVQMLISGIYANYSRKHFDEARSIRVSDKRLFKEMFAFAGWNLWGNCAGVLFTQGINLLLNVFFGPVVNAARAVAVQVEAAIQQFSTNFQMAINPQITKTFAQGDLKAMHLLIQRSARFTFLLLFVLSLPVMIEAPYILELWLKTVPEHTVVFLRIILATIIIDSMAKPLMQAAAATGRVRRYQSVVGGILLTIVPIAYIVLKLGAPAESVFIVHLCVCCFAFVVRLFIIRPMIRLSIRAFLAQTVLRAIAVVLISVPLPIYLHNTLQSSFLSAVAVCAVSVAVVAISGYIIGLDNSERSFVNSKVKAVLHKEK